MQARTWRIGLLFSATGVTGAVESMQHAATLLAVDEINDRGGVLGRRLEPVAHDPASTPELYRQLAVRLCDENRVNVIFGCHMSSTRKATLPVVESRDVLLFYPHLYEGFEYSRNCIYTGAVPNQDSVPLVKYLLDHYGNRIFLVGSDYLYPYESNRVVADLYHSGGGNVVDEMYIPLKVRADDLQRVIERIKSARPDVIYSTIVGEGIVPFFQAFKGAGLDPRSTPIASPTTSELEFRKMDPVAAHGHITVSPFFSTLTRKEAISFVANYSRRFPHLPRPTAAAEAAYFQVHLYAKALELAGTDKIDAILSALAHVEYEAPQGLIKIDPRTNHAFLWPRIGQVNATGNYDIVFDHGAAVAPDPYMLGHRELFAVPTGKGALA
ncbi:amino acid ABC transporter substrate-binding protein [Paraburkholderia steynii]|uniref:Amino acid ABC transporter substrate-binding protein n=1 Tax=Paraburkholderia steynii TaxID=1245441 RepID=A0A4R0X4C2_9BURK|nr:amino acid ABC transporter substrate-binding protein [Paraburkholderia steynii]